MIYVELQRIATEVVICYIKVLLLKAILKIKT